ncbi:MAG: hypothetical protein IT211_03300 [Armatimonadetes bacterium]|nr:hypothetical protein [Armatimonadota bacterium]
MGFFTLPGRAQVRHEPGRFINVNTFQSTGGYCNVIYHHSYHRIRIATTQLGYGARGVGSTEDPIFLLATTHWGLFFAGHRIVVSAASCSISTVQHLPQNTNSCGFCLLAILLLLEHSPPDKRRSL